MKKDLFYNKIVLSVFFMLFMLALSTSMGTSFNLTQPAPQPW